MRDVLLQTGSGHEIARRHPEEVLVDVLQALLRARFGDLGDLDDLAWRLAGCGHDGEILRIVAGATLGELKVLSCSLIAQATPIEIRLLP